MKRILITGQNSYVGNSFADWVGQYPDEFQVTKISVRDDSWKQHDFSRYDVVLHVAGIAHTKETKQNEHLYYEVNRDLAFAVAKKAKDNGVTQFVFLSSMSVYGLLEGVIDETTPEQPNTHYGKSKLEAEQLLKQLEDESFILSIIRPPMIYGKGCTGNYARLSALAKKTFLFPKIENQRSMIYISNLSEFIRKIINNSNMGLFFPQNLEYVSTSVLVKKISSLQGKQIFFVGIFNNVIKVFRISIFIKIFGDLIYKKEMSFYKENYQLFNFDKSITLTEREKV